MRRAAARLRHVRVDPGAGVDLAEQIRQQIAWLIASGNLEAGDRLPPIRSLARQLEIHMHTVRSAYSLLEADGLVTCRPGAGTRVRRLDLRHRPVRTPDIPSFTVGVILPEYSPFFLPYLRGLEQAAGDRPSNFLFGNAHDNPQRAARLLDQLAVRGVDGIVLTALPVNLADHLTPHPGSTGRLPPVVTVDIPRARGPAVVLDSESAGQAAAEHLIRIHGHELIGLVTAPLTLDNVRQVYDGFRRGLEKHRLPLRQELIAEAADFSPEEGRRAAHALLDGSPDLRAIFAVSDTLALGVLQAGRERGLRHGDDLAVVGYNDIEMAALSEPPLTTVAAPAFDMGVAAMHMLSGLIAGRRPRPVRRVLPTSLVVRQSCGCRKGS